MAIYKKLAVIQEKIKGLAKDSKGYNYTFTSGSKVIDAIKPLMISQGLLLKQEVIDVERDIIDNEVLFTLTLKFTWIDVETGEKDENIFVAAGCNKKDKGVGSALTYGERYFLLKYFHIATDKDDVDYYEEPKKEVKEAPTPAPAKEKEVPKVVAISKEKEKAIKMIKKVIPQDILETLLAQLELSTLEEATEQQLKEIYQAV